MNARTFRLVVGLGLALATAAACADPPADHAPIIVTVVQGKVQVSEDPLVLLPSEGGVAWKLDVGGRYAFPDNGIVVASPQGVHQCGVTDKGQRFYCKKLKHMAGTKYKYTVNLIPAGSGQAPEPLDPFILHQN